MTDIGSPKANLASPQCRPLIRCRLVLFRIWRKRADLFVVDEPADLGGGQRLGRRAVDVDDVAGQVAAAAAADGRPVARQEDDVHAAAAADRREGRRLGRHLAPVGAAAGPAHLVHQHPLRVRVRPLRFHRLPTQKKCCIHLLQP